ncbi:hypothetical protein ACFQZR_19705 [Paenibacillus sp. GCM10027629]|uniref:hypothetical protein n=1 Tax=Paenibacillus sp. GCM10027629 TaxID=3273414 RepID=UPI00363CBF12
MDVDPIVEQMWKRKGYIRATTATPIFEGAVPAYIFADGVIYPIELDEELFSQLFDMFEEHQYMLSLNNPGMTIPSNPYELI